MGRGLFPGLPDIGAVPDGDELAVAYDGGVEKLGIVKEFLLGGIGCDVRHIEILVGTAFGVNELLEAQLLAHAAVLSGRETLLGQIDVLVLDAPFLEPTLGFFAVKTFGRTENLDVH